MDVAAIAALMVAMRTQQSRGTIGAAIIKMNAEMDQSVVQLLQAQAAPGTGLKVDIRA